MLHLSLISGCYQLDRNFRKSKECSLFLPLLLKLFRSLSHISYFHRSISHQPPLPPSICNQLTHSLLISFCFSVSLSVSLSLCLSVSLCVYSTTGVAAWLSH